MMPSNESQQTEEDVNFSDHLWISGPMVRASVLPFRLTCLDYGSGMSLIQSVHQYLDMLLQYSVLTSPHSSPFHSSPPHSSPPHSMNLGLSYEMSHDMIS